MRLMAVGAIFWPSGAGSTRKCRAAVSLDTCATASPSPDMVFDMKCSAKLFASLYCPGWGLELTAPRQTHHTFGYYLACAHSLAQLICILPRLEAAWIIAHVLYGDGLPRWSLSSTLGEASDFHSLSHSQSFHWQPSSPPYCGQRATKSGASRVWSLTDWMGFALTFEVISLAPRERRSVKFNAVCADHIRLKPGSNPEARSHSCMHP